MRLLATLIALASAAAGAAEPPLHLEPWSQELFVRAGREHKLVLLDLGAVWCHWCHVMDETTYRDPAVVDLLERHYLVARVDQDGSPDLAARYGDWGWPATIVLAADGTELVKRRGYLPPERMRALLQAIVDDPTPGPSVEPAAEWRAAAGAALPAGARARLEAELRADFDEEHAGWGRGHKYVDLDALAYALERGADGDQALGRMARRTLDAARGLADPVWGGVNQYSDSADWRAPHFEKIMAVQAQSIRAYALAYRVGGDAADLALALGVVRYLDRFLTSPDGAFYTSQDADLDARVDGKRLHALDDAGRVALGVPPVDRHIYPRENGWAIAALASLYATTGDAALLARATRAAAWIGAHRALPGGGFAHDAPAAARGPYLADTLAMAQGFLALHAVTGERAWLARAEAAARFIDARFRDGQAGYVAAPAPAGSIGVFRRAARDPDENVAVARLGNLLYQYSDTLADRAMADHAMAFLASPTVLAARPFAPGTLLADRELGSAPVHVTVVGGKDDPRAAALWAAALRTPTEYLRTEWWDRREGPLPRADVAYPDLGRPAAFACSGSACSMPITDPAKVAAAVAGVQGRP